MSGKKTLVLGASPNDWRYSFMAVTRLRAAGHDVVAVGRRTGRIGDVDITTAFPDGGSFHTVTLYLNAANQKPYYDRILALKPERVIFNPGADNAEFEALLGKAGIETEEACTLVLLSTGGF